MSFKNFSKKIKRSLARRGILLCYWLIEHLPFFIVKGVLTLLLSFAFRLMIRLKRIARESLRMAFGEEKTEEQIEQIVKDCFKTIRKGVIELMYYSRFPDNVTDIVTVQGKEHIDQVLAQGKGAILITAHFGNFPLMMLALSQMGYKVNVILRRARDPKIADVMLGIMDKVGVRTIYSRPERRCVVDSIKALRNNEILFILMDQNFGAGGGVYVEFFGRKSATAVGPVVFAARTGAPIVPVFTVRGEGSEQCIYVEPAVNFPESDKSDETKVVYISRLTNIIEKYIRKYPHEWGWMHRRWKSQKSS